MGKVWRVAKSVFGLRMCTWSFAADSADDYISDDCDSAATHSRPPTAPNTPGRSSASSSSITRSSFRLLKGSCAICLEPIKSGSGQALFTAECSHTFHFSCIASNVRHGNMVCPVCRAKWKEVPWQGPAAAGSIPRNNNNNNIIPSSPSPRHQRSSQQFNVPPSPLRSFNTAPVQDFFVSNPEEQDPVIRIIDESIANAQGNRTPPRGQQQVEPVVYDDDEALAGASGESSAQRNSASSSSDQAEAFQETVEDLFASTPEFSKRSKDCNKVDLSAFAEVGSVSYAEERNAFNVLVHIKAPESCKEQNYQGTPTILDPSQRAPIDLVTVLDVSGSMAGTKLLLLKRAMAFVIRNLSSHDRLSVVVFSSSAKRLFPLKTMIEEGRQFALRAIDTLVCTGGTNIAEGLRKGSKVLEERRYRNPVASIMLLSDGQDTYSMGARNQVVAAASPARDHYLHHLHHHKVMPTNGNISFDGRVTRIPVHTFGFGADHDAATMHAISQVSGGTFSFIQAEGGVQDAFAQCVGGLLSVVVQDVQLVISTTGSSSSSSMQQQNQNQNFDFAPKIRDIQAGSYRSTVSEDSAQGIVKLGDLYADEERDVLVELKLPALRSRIDECFILEVGCSHTDPVHHQLHTTSRKLSISRPDFVSANQQRVSVEVDRQKNRLLAARSITEAGFLAEGGDIEAAQRVLRATQLAIQGSLAVHSGDRLSLDLEAELGEIQLRIGNRQLYERCGRAYILSAQSSHLTQRATMRGHSVEGYSRDYQTPSMTGMILRSQQHFYNQRSPSPRHYRA